jgi:hypothetical protein
MVTGFLPLPYRIHGYRCSPFAMVTCFSGLFDLCYYRIIMGCRDSSVGIATRYGLDGARIEFRWGRDFPLPTRPAWGPHSLLYNGYRVPLPGGKTAGTLL